MTRVPRYAQLYVMDGKITGIQWRVTSIILYKAWNPGNR